MSNDFINQLNEGLTTVEQKIQGVTRHREHVRNIIKRDFMLRRELKNRFHEIYSEEESDAIVTQLEQNLRDHIHEIRLIDREIDALVFSAITHLTGIQKFGQIGLY